MSIVANARRRRGGEVERGVGGGKSVNFAIIFDKHKKGTSVVRSNMPSKLSFTRYA